MLISPLKVISARYQSSTSLGFLLTITIVKTLLVPNTDSTYFYHSQRSAVLKLILRPKSPLNC